MKVLHICPKLGSGGIEILIKQWYERAKAENIEFIFAVYLLGGEAYQYFTERGCKIYKIERLKDVGFCKYCFQIEDIIRREKIDTLHINAGLLTSIALYVAKKAGVRSRILHAHTTRYNLKSIFGLEKIILKIARKFNVRYSTVRVCCGKKAGDFCFGLNGWDLFLPNGINIDKFTFTEQKREETRRRLNIKQEDKVIGFVGRLDQQKNPMFLLALFKSIANERSKFCLLIVGDGKLRRNMEEFVKKENLPRVIFAGVKPDVENYYSAMDVLVMPSFYEGFPIAAVEAQSVGLPLVVSSGITDEVKMTDLVIKRSLSDPVSLWVSDIIKQSHRSVCREKYASEVKNLGFDEERTCDAVIRLYKTEYIKRYREKILE